MFWKVAEVWKVAGALESSQWFGNGLRFLIQRKCKKETARGFPERENAQKKPLAVSHTRKCENRNRLRFPTRENVKIETACGFLHAKK